MLTGLSLSPAPDVDGYRVYWDAGGTAVVETTGATDTVMAYYDGPGAPDVIDDDGGVDRNARISTSVSAQSEVWYGVEGYRATTTGSYGLTVDGPPAASTAITIDGDPSRGTATGSIDSAWDYDFFHFTTTAAGPWFVAIWPTGNWDPTMLVYDNLGNPVGGTFTSPIDDAAVGGFETWSASLSLGQTYYVRVENAALGAGGAYTLKVEGPDPDDQISEALSTAVGSTVGGSISASHDDVDMFSFTVSAGQTLGFDIDGDAASSLDSYIRVFDGNGVELAFNNRDMGPAPEPSLTESYLQYTFNTAGTYYIGVSSMFNTQYDPITGDDPMRSMTSGAYQLSITLDLPDLVGWSFDAIYHVTGEVVDAGGYVPVDFTISNRGPGPAATWSTLAFYVSDDDTITASDIRRGHVVVPALAGGGIYSGTVIVNLPDPDPFRTDNEYWVGVIVDSGDRIPEQDETNNANRGVLKDKDRIMSERHLPGPTDGNSVHATYLIPNVPESEDIGDDEWIGAYDQDILQFTPPAVGGTVSTSTASAGTWIRTSASSTRHGRWWGATTTAGPRTKYRRISIRTGLGH